MGPVIAFNLPCEKAEVVPRVVMSFHRYAMVIIVVSVLGPAPDTCILKSDQLVILQVASER
jgi:hypothetical protein